MLDYQIQVILQELLVGDGGSANTKNASYRDDQIDELMLEIKNLKNTNNLSAIQLLGNSVTVLLNRIPLQRVPVDDWPREIAKTCKPYENLWRYLRRISDDDDRSECVFRVYEYCQNPKRPHLRNGFGFIVSSLLAGNIVCEVAVVKFIAAMENSEDESERHSGVTLVPFLTRSCPW